MSRTPKPLCPRCNERPIAPQFTLCLDCFADEAMVMEAFMQIKESHGTVKAMAALPVLKKVVKTGWKEEYRQEYEAKLNALQSH